VIRHNWIIREESEQDMAQVFVLNQAAFETDAEAQLVDAMRAQIHGVISLVAVEGDQVLGHIMFSPVTVGGGSEVKIYGLAPMAVDPAVQKQGIGSALVKAGLEYCKSHQVEAVVVLGHSAYYPRFGFKTAADFGLDCEYEVPSEVFMAQALNPGSLNVVEGVVKYHPVFATVS